jgi:AmiR/NasT family two-component response regulator
VLHHPLTRVYTFGGSNEESALPEPEHRLQVLIVNERDDHLENITALVEALGHEIVGRGLDLGDVGPLSRSTGADVALVGLGLDNEHALQEISEIVQEAACPVITLLDVKDPRYVLQAAQRGVFAYVVLDGDEAGELQSALDITLRRFAEFQNLQGAFGRRAIIEQAKGILMERNRIDADAAFAVLKSHSQQSGQRLNDVAQAITQSHLLFSPGRRTDEPAG